MTGDGGLVGIILYRVVKEGLPGKVTFEQRPGESKGMSYMDIWGKNVPVRGNSKCKGSEANIPCVFKEQQGNDDGVKDATGNMVGNEIRRIAGSQVM